MSGKSGHTLRLIEHLVHLKFPGLEIADQVFADDPGSMAELQKQIDAYRAELSCLSDDELEIAAEATEAAAWLAEQQYRLSQEELGRFFNQPGAKADYEAWGIMASWTLDQATALTLGKEPTVVTWERVNEFLDVSSFARRYAQRRTFLQTSGIVFPVSPSEFVAWAKRLGLRIPHDLIAKFERRKGEPVEPDHPTPAPAAKLGRPRIIPAVKQVIQEVYKDCLPEAVTKAVQNNIGQHMEEKGLESPSKETIKRALGELRAGQKGSKMV